MPCSPGQHLPQGQLDTSLSQIVAGGCSSGLNSTFWSQCPRGLSGACVLGQQVLTSGRGCHTHRSQEPSDHTQLSAKSLEGGSRRAGGWGQEAGRPHHPLLIPAARHPQLKRWVLTRTLRTLSTQTRFSGTRRQHNHDIHPFR